MNHGKRPKLSCGLRWDPKSSYICFSWRDAHGSQHQQCTHTADPAEAMAFKLNFLREKKDAAEERKVQSEDRSRLPLEKASELYFNWKAADISLSELLPYSRWSIPIRSHASYSSRLHL